VTMCTRGCKRRLFASTQIEDLLGPYLSISATSQSTLSPSNKERCCCIIPRYCALRVSLRADSQRVSMIFKEYQFPMQRGISNDQSDVEP